mgnify:CR=1 FL=1
MACGALRGSNAIMTMRFKEIPFTFAGFGQ